MSSKSFLLKKRDRVTPALQELAQQDIESIYGGAQDPNLPFLSFEPTFDEEVFNFDEWVVVD